MAMRDGPGGIDALSGLAEDGIAPLNDRHVLGAGTNVNPNVMNRDDKGSWLATYCYSHPDAKYQDAELALYKKMAELEGLPTPSKPSDVNLPCSDINTLYEKDPKLAATIFDGLVVQGMHYFDDHHVLGESVHVDFAVMKPAEEVGFFRAWCAANPTEHIAQAMYALYRRMADLSAPGAAAAIPPPPQGTPPGAPLPMPAQGLFPPSGNAAITAAIKEASGEPLDALEKNIEHMHPAAMIILAKRLEEGGRHDDALFWFAEGQIRWMTFVMQTRDPAEQNAFERISSGAGVEINKYPARDAERLRAAIDKALAWDQSHADAYTPPGPAKENARKLLEDLKAHVVAEPNELARENREAQQQATASSDDPYSGSGGAMFGTPQEMVPAYDEAKYTGFRIGVTTKAEVVKALGAPEVWFTDKDGSTTLDYPVAMTNSPMAAMGLVRRMSVGFTFDAKRVLTKVDLPKDQ
ncbi:MAG TPA: hypothetical protein VMU22_06575 [Rhizomicrobium sp.]|nr:hypothetical protein [Rhizomicrobium sp.]